MQKLAKVTQSGVARTIGLAMVLALVAVGTAYTHADLSQTHNFTVKVYEGDPAQNKLVPNVTVRLNANTAGNPTTNITLTTDGNGTVVFNGVHEDGYKVEIAYNNSSYYSRDYNVYIDSDTTLEASILPTSSGTSPNLYNLTVKVYDGDPAQNKLLSGINVKTFADDSSSTTKDREATTDGNGTAGFQLVYGGYTVHLGDGSSDFYTRDYHVFMDSDTTLEASLINKTPTGGVIGTGTECLPTPPRGKPMLNIWPISETAGATCHDYSLLAVKNATTGGSYVTGNGTVSATDGQTIQVELYVHNGVLDYPENIAYNVQVKSVLPTSSGTITASAWANNADLITSDQKGGNVNISLGANQSLEYISGSTKLYDNTGAFQANLPDGITAGGVSIGDMHGCWPFLHFVTFQARVKTAATLTPTPGVMAFDKTVRNVTKNETTFVDAVHADPGDQVEFKLVVTAVSGLNEHVVVSDTLPSRLIYVAGSLHVDGHADGSALNNIPFLTMDPGTSHTITLRATVADAAHFDVGDTTLVNTATGSSNTDSKTDTANVIVRKTTSIPPPPTPVNPTLRVVKIVVGGTSSVSDFPLFVNGTAVTSGAVNTFAPGNYTVTETNKTGYVGSFSGDCNLSGVVTLVSGDNKSCILTNTYQVVNQNTTLSIYKSVANVTAGTGYDNAVNANNGNTVDFRIVVANTGSNDANNVIVSDILPSGLVFNDHLVVTGSTGYSGTITASPYLKFPKIGAGKSVSIFFYATVNSNPSCNLRLTNVATASADNASGVSDNALVVLPTCTVNPPNLTLSKTAWNETQNKNATTVTAKAGDQITYILTAENTGDSVMTNYIFSDDISDVLKLATAFDIDGGTLTNGVISYPATSIPAHTKVNRAFRVQIKNPTPKTGDCTMSNTFGNTININVSCAPFVAPPTGSTTALSLLLAGMTLIGAYTVRSGKFHYVVKLIGSKS